MQKALAPELSTWPAESPQLIGSRCGACSAVTFPRQDRCPRCSGTEMADLLLPRRGRLIAFTTQGFLPKEPYAGGETTKTFETFGVGLIQLDDVVRVETRLTEADPGKLVPGMEMELAIVPFYTDEDGMEVVTVAFAPA
jgi:uncharacterized protein